MFYSCFHRRPVYSNTNLVKPWFLVLRLYFFTFPWSYIYVKILNCGFHVWKWHSISILSMWYSLHSYLWDSRFYFWDANVKSTSNSSLQCLWLTGCVRRTLWRLVVMKRLGSDIFDLPIEWHMGSHEMTLKDILVSYICYPRYHAVPHAIVSLSVHRMT